MAKPFGIDISRYQYSADGRQKPDFDKIKATCRYIAIRQGISWGYKDPWFNYSWEMAKGLPRMAYHVGYFGESAIRQMDNLFGSLGGANFDHDRIVLDNEVQHTNSKWTITNTTNQFLSICKSRTGRYPMIYSRANWVDQYMNVADMPADLYWWFAQYLYPRPYPLFTPEHPGPPALPKGVKNWLLHQTGEKYSGSSVGVVSHYVDSNRWNTLNIGLLDYFGITEPVLPPPPPPLTLEQRVADNTRRIEILEAR